VQFSLKLRCRRGGNSQEGEIHKKVKIHKRVKTHNLEPLTLEPKSWIPSPSGFGFTVHFGFNPSPSSPSPGCRNPRADLGGPAPGSRAGGARP